MYRTNELVGEDGHVINRLAPVQCNGIDGNVAVMGISLYHLDDSVVNTRCLGFLLLCSAVCLFMSCDSVCPLACECVCCLLSVLCVRGSL